MSERAQLSYLFERAVIAVAAIGVVLCSLFLWIGVPALGMWVAGELTTSVTGFLFATLSGIPLAMIGTGWLLYRLGAWYEHLRHADEAAPAGRSAWLVSQSDERSSYRRARAPRALVEVSMAGSAVLALVLIVVWFFFLAEMKLAPMQ